MTNKQYRCLNCGTLCSDNFCPHCGQSTKVGRFDGRLFLTTAISNVSRMSATYFTTAYGLLIHPWAVIRGYVYGRRVRYVAPLSMMLLTALYLSMILPFINYDFQFVQTDSQNVWIQIISETVNKSIALQFLLFSPVIAVTTYIAYYGKIRGRFNFFEICIAVLFYLSIFLLYNIVAVPLECISTNLCNVVVLVAVLVVGVTGLIKAFPQPSASKTILRLIFWAVLNVVILAAYILGMLKLLSHVV